MIYYFLGIVVEHPSSKEEVSCLKEVFQWFFLYRSCTVMYSSSWCLAIGNTIVESREVEWEVFVSYGGDQISLRFMANALVHYLKFFFFCDSSSQTWVKKEQSSNSSTQDVVVVSRRQREFFGSGNKLMQYCPDTQDIFDITYCRIKIKYLIS